MFEYERTALQDAVLIKLPIASDHRGQFVKSFERAWLREAGIEFDVWEAFETYSHQGVLRGLHFQTATPQAKLVRVQSGAVYDVIVDLRSGSPSFGKWAAFELSAGNRHMLYVPRGFAHGFYVPAGEAVVSYLCDAPFSPETDGGLRWDDPHLNIQWPIPPGETPVVSARDLGLMSYQQFLMTQGFSYLT